MEGTTEQISTALAVETEAEKRENRSAPGKNNSDRSRPAAGQSADSQVAEPGATENGRHVVGKPGKDADDATKVQEVPVQERPLTPRDPVEINLRTLLQAGVHFGHQTARWNPAMAQYIHGSRNGIHIISLPRTVSGWEKAREAIVDIAAKGGSVLFVGTKKQAHDAVIEEARRCGAFYVAQRWLGGMMTNFQTIRKSIARMNRLEEILAEEEKSAGEGVTPRFTKKERLMMSRERDKLYFSLGGIRTMYGAPQLMFLIDVNREDIAVKEASRLDIPVVALVDTNCDPNVIDFPIPSNDDGTRAIRLFCAAVADAVLEGKNVHQKHLATEAAATAAAKKSRKTIVSAEQQVAGEQQAEKAAVSSEPVAEAPAAVAEPSSTEVETETETEAAAEVKSE